MCISDDIDDDDGKNSDLCNCDDFDNCYMYGDCCGDGDTDNVDGGDVSDMNRYPFVYDGNGELNYCGCGDGSTDYFNNFDCN